jgi:hypothetical protein
MFLWSRRPRGMKHGSAAARLLGLWVRIPPGHGYLSLVIVVYCQEEVSASSWSLVQRSPTEWDVSECDGEAWTMRRPWPTRGSCKKKQLDSQLILGIFRQPLHISGVSKPIIRRYNRMCTTFGTYSFRWLSVVSAVTTESHLKRIINTNCCTRVADKSLARPTSRCVLFDGENISFDASLVIYINIALIFLQVWL